MQRVREHRIHLNRILRHESLNPNRALLAQALQMWIDADPEEKELMSQILRGVWVNPKQINWKDEGDPGIPNPESKTEAEDMATMRGIFSQIVANKGEK